MRYRFDLIPDPEDFKKDKLIDVAYLIETAVKRDIEKKLKKECEGWEIEFNGEEVKK